MKTLLQKRGLLIGVVHLAPLPGAPRYGGSMEAVLANAVRDARALAKGGCDGVIVENFGDVPFFRGAVPPETVAGIGRAVSAVRDSVGELPVGVNVLRNDGRAALAICATTGASFLRINVLVGVMVTDQGMISGEAASVLRARMSLAPDACILADVHVKHAKPLASEGGDLARVALDTAERAMADALILSGERTGAPPQAAELEEVQKAVGETPILVGSGATPERIAEWGSAIDGAIVGTWIKHDGRVENAVDAARVALVRKALDAGAAIPR